MKSKGMLLLVLLLGTSCLARAEEIPPANHAGATAHLHDQEPFYLGQRATDDLPRLTEEELSTPQQLALLSALGGDPYGPRLADHCRAGWPLSMRQHANPSNTLHYGGYWVGGGRALKGEAPFADEGTFGWDYFGLLLRKRIDLHWSHGHRQEGGAGAYQTDGPRPRRGH